MPSSRAHGTCWCRLVMTDSLPLVIYCTDCGERVDALPAPCPQSCPSASRHGHTLVAVEHDCRPSAQGAD